MVIAGLLKQNMFMYQTLSLVVEQA